MKLSEELKDKLRDDIPLSHSDIIRLSQLEAELEEANGLNRTLEINLKGANDTVEEIHEQLQQAQAELETKDFALTKASEMYIEVEEERDALVQELNIILDWNVADHGGTLPPWKPILKLLGRDEPPERKSQEAKMKPTDEKPKCPRCRGQGYETYHNFWTGEELYDAKCPDCHGTGYQQLEMEGEDGTE